VYYKNQSSVFERIALGTIQIPLLLNLYNMQENKATWLQQALIKLDLITDSAYQKEVSAFFDEQPYLMGFLFNLEEEFSENTHELLMRAALAFYQTMGSIGLEFEVVTPQLLNDTVSKKVEDFNRLEKDNLAFDESELFSQISSPQAVKSLLKYIDENTAKSEFEESTRNNMLLILSALVEIMESAAALPDQKQAQ
jgi:hypothetical protein